MGTLVAAGGKLLDDAVSSMIELNVAAVARKGMNGMIIRKKMVGESKNQNKSRLLQRIGLYTIRFGSGGNGRRERILSRPSWSQRVAGLDSSIPLRKEMVKGQTEERRRGRRRTQIGTTMNKP